MLDLAQCGPTFLRQPGIAELVLASIGYGVEIGHCQMHSWVILPDRNHSGRTKAMPSASEWGGVAKRTAVHRRQPVAAGLAV